MPQLQGAPPAQSKGPDDKQLRYQEALVRACRRRKHGRVRHAQPGSRVGGQHGGAEVQHQQVRVRSSWQQRPARELHAQDHTMDCMK